MSLTISLPWPHKLLWSNGRHGNFYAKAAEAGKHRKWAWAATMEQPRPTGLLAPIPVRVTVYPKAKGPFPDALNVGGACKAYFDGIADALAINDRDFDAPEVLFDARREGRVEITLGPIQKETGE